MPDNRHIVLDGVSLDRPGSHLFLADTQSGAIRPITSGTVEEQSPSVSPAGDRIAFAAGGNDFDLVRIPIDGSDLQTLLASARSPISHPFVERLIGTIRREYLDRTLFWTGVDLE